MIVLRVQVNDEPPVVAGAEDLGVLSAIVTAGGKLGREARSARPGEPFDIHLSLGGLTARAATEADEHVRWVSRFDLGVGDKVVVEVLEATSADPVESVSEAEKRQHDERAFFEHCKQVYFDLRDKYDANGSTVAPAST